MAHRLDFQISLPPDQLLDRLYFRGIDHGGTGSLVSGLESEISDYRHFCPRLKRKDRAFILEEDRALRRGLSCQRMVPFNIELLAMALGRLCGRQHCIEQLIHAGIQIFHGERSVLHRFHQLSRRAEPGCRHLQIGSGFDSRHMIVCPAPVGDHKSVIVPVAAQDFLKQVHALVGVLAVDLIIGSHDCSGFRLVDRHFKSGQINLAQGALIYDRVHCHAALLLGVDRKVLNAGINALALDSLHIGSGHPARQIRIFRKILKVSPAQRASLYIHTGPQQNIDAHSLGLFAQRDAYLRAQISVPAARHRGRRRETCRRQRRIKSEMITCAGLSSESVRAVRHDHRRNVQAGDIPGVPLALTAE